ncbi:MAG TPA: 3D domain-containing protein [Phycisphaerales bacterium]|nr:3D domain-containing protein [Phycisphaerales bacterium]HRQ74394.1 3D domain-containing protein [Phycisphaerales bacterium]
MKISSNTRAVSVRLGWLGVFPAITVLTLSGLGAASWIGATTMQESIEVAPDEFGFVEVETIVSETEATVIEVISDASDIRWFDGRPIRPARTMTMLVTAYSPDERSCGKWADGITASGYSVWTNGMKMVAADTSILPFGSLVSIPGYDGGSVVPVLDRGGKIKGNRLDVLYPTHERALKWGAQRLEVTIWEYADGEPVGFRTNHRRRR